jgi:uncharacterized protein YndB with AHSA1/START domain
MSKMTLKTEGDTHVVVTRSFAAPPQAVYRAHTDPTLIQIWLLGPEGWTMPVCLCVGQSQGWRFSHHWRISAARALWKDRACRAHAPARSHTGQSY